MNRSSEPTRRFSKTVENYVKYRPGYPQEVIDLLKNECGLPADAVIADVGSGTGIFSKLLLENGYTVLSVEPNPEMRTEAERQLSHYKKFVSVNAAAEATTLNNNNVDCITVATAFHWFDPEKSKLEFKRILKPNGWLVLIWNVRDINNSPLLQDYENLILKYGTDYRDSSAMKFDKSVGEDFFSPNKMKTRSFKNSQQLDWEGLKGRLLSASYSLQPGDANYEAMLQALKVIYERHQQNGAVNFLYETKVYYGYFSD